MVRVYLKTRYTKQTTNDLVTNNILNWFGGFQPFARAKVIHSAAVWVNPNDAKLYSININENSPKCKQDFWMLNFLRTYSDCIVTTGNILRKEPLAFHPEVPKQLGLPVETYFKKGGKPIAILTGNLEKNLWTSTNSNLVYSDARFKKHIIVKPSVKQRFESYSDSFSSEAK